MKGHDGVEVPASIIMRADTRQDGSNPTILYGYGAYGTTEDPGWSPRLLAWLERGGVFVIAHVRGGGVFGDAWHRAGQKATKPNTWKDGIAVADWLIAQKYTSRDKLAVIGGSAGGIFVGRAMTERPDLFAAAVISVGNTDLVRSETRANGVANVPEYGTVKREDEFRALLEMSTVRVDPRRRQVSGGTVRARRQRHPRRRLDDAEDSVATVGRHYERPPGVAAARIRRRARRRRHPESGPAAHR